MPASTQISAERDGTSSWLCTPCGRITVDFAQGRCQTELIVLRDQVGARLTTRTAPEIVADIATTLRREFPELLVRDAAQRGDLEAGLGALVRWLLDRIGTDDRLARVGASRICDQLLRDGFPRRPLLRALALVREELVSSARPADRAAAERVTTALIDALTRRLVPDAPASSAIAGLVGLR
jgi:hypothetical protein